MFAHIGLGKDPGIVMSDNAVTIMGQVRQVGREATAEYYCCEFRSAGFARGDITIGVDPGKAEGN